MDEIDQIVPDSGAWGPCPCLNSGPFLGRPLIIPASTTTHAHVLQPTPCDWKLTCPPSIPGYRDSRPNRPPSIDVRTPVYPFRIPPAGRWGCGADRSMGRVAPRFTDKHAPPSSHSSILQSYIIDRGEKRVCDFEGPRSIDDDDDSRLRAHTQQRLACVKRKGGDLTWWWHG